MAHVHHPDDTPLDPSSMRAEDALSGRGRRSPRARERNRPLTIALAIGAALIAAVIVAFALGDEGDRRLDAPVDDGAVPVRPGQPAR